MAGNARRPADSPRPPRTAKAADAGKSPSAPSGRPEAQEGSQDGKKSPFLSDVRTLRERARKHIEEGPVTAGYGANLPTVLRLLNDALATELVCVLRYKQHYFAATGTRGETVAAEFLQHATEEQQHADLIAARMVQLGGSPDFNPSGLLSRSHSEYVEGNTLTEMVREDLVAERVAIDSYREMIDYIGDGDVTTRRMLEGILAVEEEHADDLRDLLADMKG